MDIRQLQYFMLVSEHGGFSAAATSSGVGQPAISRQIKLLEEEVGTPLFLRHGRGIVLTGAGRRLLDHARAIVDRMERAKADLAEINNTMAGEIVLGLPASIGSTLTAPLLKRFMSGFPLVKLSVVEGLSGHLHEWLLRGDVDLAVVYLPRVSSELFSETLSSDQIYLVGSPETGVHADTIDFEDVLGLPLILTSQLHALRREVDLLAKKRARQINVKCEVDSILSIKDLVAEGYGYALLPLRLVRPELDSGRLHSVRIVNPELTRNLLLAMSPRTKDTPLTRAVRKEIKAIVADGAN
ncbi:LysR family transcriptional regulator [Bradyrhizobium sp. Ce-3]|uniref:LysR family transcriptional regulator n=1 Tax=Bradyrhizobium sp. Ce-3 TaxID=2913970 RepID=UPI001FC86D7D|nr:LysR family transcriptional regulator [Bradyrhizobium sp. Ce-3]GKQ55116.1 LysR family transcriptional regulator [Bradyrhizobium sp. Ce-3]